MEKDEITEIRMYVPEESSTGSYDVIKVSDSLYKLANNDPFNEKMSYGTIIRVSPYKIESGKNEFIFREIYAESKFNLQVIGLPMSLNESELRTVGEMIVKEGGFWEIIFGGMGFINLPKESKLNVIDQLNKLIKSNHDT